MESDIIFEPEFTFVGLVLVSGLAESVLVSEGVPAAEDVPDASVSNRPFTHAEGPTGDAEENNEVLGLLLPFAAGTAPESGEGGCGGWEDVGTASVGAGVFECDAGVGAENDEA